MYPLKTYCLTLLRYQTSPSIQLFGTVTRRKVWFTLTRSNSFWKQISIEKS